MTTEYVTSTLCEDDEDDEEDLTDVTLVSDDTYRRLDCDESYLVMKVN